MNEKQIFREGLLGQYANIQKPGDWMKGIIHSIDQAEGFTIEQKSRAKEIARTLNSNQCSGMSRITLAAACAYIAVKEEDKTVTQARIADNFGITEVSLRKRLSALFGHSV